MFDEYFSKANELNSQGIPFATAVVVRAEKPTSAKPGDKAIVTVDGVMHGWIGGSCAQPTVIREATQAISDGASRLIRLSVDPTKMEPREGLIDLPMTCFSGGTLEIFIEPQRPLPHLMVIGNLPVAQALVTLGKAMSYRVTAVDPDTHGKGMDAADRIVTQLSDIPNALTAQTFVVVATHGNFDEAALAMVLSQPVPYVGLVASQRRLQAVNEYLSMQGLGDKEMGRLKCPAGLNIHAKRGDEIALSIMAEIVQKRQENPEIDVNAFFEKVETAVEPSEPPTIELSPNAIDLSGMMMSSVPAASTENSAIDPICHMTVDIATAKYVSEYEGQKVYFCCAGCKTAFDKAPAEYQLK